MGKVLLYVGLVAGACILDILLGYEAEEPQKEEKETKMKILWQQLSNGKSKYRGPGKWH